MASHWPFQVCGSAGIPAWQYLQEIHFLAGAAPPSKRKKIRELVDDCMLHTHFEPDPEDPRSHCDLVSSARNASLDGNWDLVIEEMTHGN